jgi:hypothetical protein
MKGNPATHPKCGLLSEVALGPSALRLAGQPRRLSQRDYFSACAT